MIWRTSLGALALSLCALGCGRHAGQPPNAANVRATPAVTDDGQCEADDTGLELQEVVRGGGSPTIHVSVRCAADAPDGTRDVERALATVAARLTFLGAPREGLVRGPSTVEGTLPKLDAPEVATIAAPGMIAFHEVDEEALLALGGPALPTALSDEGIRFRAVPAALVARFRIPLSMLEDLAPVPGRQWMTLPTEGSGDEQSAAVPTYPAAVSSEDVEPCAARVLEGDNPSVLLRLTPRGAERLEALTERAQGKRVLLALDGVALAAPVVQEVIRDGELQLSSSSALVSRVGFAMLRRPLPAGVRCQVASSDASR